jgi:outer membrane biosynthesis protein TonB
MKPGLTISCVGHACALLSGLVFISAQPLDAPPTESLPVEFISAKDFSQMTQGVKNAPKLKVDDIKPLADKVDTPKPVKQLAPKVVDKPEITTESAAPKSEPKPQPKPDPKAEAKSEPKPADKAEKTKSPDLKLDQIADILKKDEAKKPAKAEEKQKPQKETHQSPKFDANQVAALLDKRDPQRQMAAAQTLNNTANLGASDGQAAQLSQSEIDALRARISQCWNPPAGVDINSKIYVVLRVLFRPDGSLARDPAVVEGSPSAMGPALAESGKRALMTCQPFTMLKPEHYDQWKDIEVKFDPHELLGG